MKRLCSFALVLAIIITSLPVDQWNASAVSEKRKYRTDDYGSGYMPDKSYAGGDLRDGITLTGNRLEVSIAGVSGIGIKVGESVKSVRFVGVSGANLNVTILGSDTDVVLYGATIKGSLFLSGAKSAAFSLRTANYVDKGIDARGDLLIVGNASLSVDGGVGASGNDAICVVGSLDIDMYGGAVLTARGKNGTNGASGTSAENKTGQPPTPPQAAANTNGTNGTNGERAGNGTDGNHGSAGGNAVAASFLNVLNSSTVRFIGGNGGNGGVGGNGGSGQKGGTGQKGGNDEEGGFLGIGEGPVPGKGGRGGNGGAGGSGGDGGAGGAGGMPVVVLASNFTYSDYAELTIAAGMGGIGGKGGNGGAGGAGGSGGAGGDSGSSGSDGSTGASGSAGSAGNGGDGGDGGAHGSLLAVGKYTADYGSAYGSGGTKGGSGATDGNPGQNGGQLHDVLPTTMSLTMSIPDGAKHIISNAVLSNTEITLERGSEETLAVITTPVTSGDSSIIWRWESDNPNIASVDINGRVTANNIAADGGEGTAKITARSGAYNGNAALTCTVRVKVSATGIALDKTSASLDYEDDDGLTNKTTVTATVSPSNATTKDILWTSSDESVITVSKMGSTAIVAVSPDLRRDRLPATATVTAKTVDGEFAKSCTITVNPVTLNSITIKDKIGTQSLRNGTSELLIPVFHSSDATFKDIVWSSSDSSVISVDTNGRITAHKVGYAKITASSVVGEKTASVDYNAVEQAIPAKSISISPETLTLMEGHTGNINLTITPANTTDKGTVWTSDNEDVATVDNGIVTASRAGTARITVKLNGLTKTCTVVVNQKITAAPFAVPTARFESVPYGTALTLLSTTDDAQIRYTMDGSPPTQNSALFEKSLTLTKSVVVMARAFRIGHQDSAVSVFNYTVSLLPPTSSPAAPASLHPGDEIKLWAAEGATIRYTTNGSEPTESSPIYTDPIIFSNGMTIKAKAYLSGMSPSDTANLVFHSKVFMPDSSVRTGGVLAKGEAVELMCATEGATLYYTTDGTQPSDPTTRKLYNGSIALTESVTIRAIGTKVGYTDSEIGIFKYKVAEKTNAPVMSYRGTDIFKGGRTVVIEASSAKIFYTTDGSAPTKMSREYLEPLVITSEDDIFTVKAIAVKDGFAPSDVTTYQYKGAQKPLTTTLGVGKFSFPMPDWVPIFGGKQMSFDAGSFPASVIIEDNKVKVGIGYEFKNKDDIWTLKNCVKELRSGGNFVKNAKALALAGGLSGIIDASAPKATILGNVEPTFEIIGYGEWVLPKNGQGTSFAIDAYLKIGLKTENEFQYVVWVIPVVVSLDIAADITYGGRFAVSGEQLKSEHEISLLFPHVELRLGVGMAHVLNGGVYGSVDLNVLWQMTRKTVNAKLSGEAGWYVEVLTYVHRGKIVSGTIWESGWVYGSSAIQEDIPAITSYADYSLAPREYLDASSYVVPDLRMRNAPGDIKVIYNSAYTQSKPLIAEANGTRIAIWIGDDGTKDDYNRSTLMYQTYNAATDTWSAPVAVSENGTSDFYPDITSDGNNIWVAWHDSKRLFDPGDTLENMLAEAEISVARFDGTGFSDINRLTDNAILDSQPKIATFGGETYAVWVQNSLSDIFGTTGVNNIMFSKYTNSGWDPPSELKSNVKAVTGLEMGFFGNSVQAAYIVDKDNSLSTSDDKELCIIELPSGSCKTIKSGGVISNPQFASVNGVESLCFYENGNISHMNTSGSMTGLFDVADMPTDLYKILTDSSGNSLVLYPNKENGSDYIAARAYKNSRWSKEFTIADTDGYAKSIDGVWEANGEISLFFNNAHVSIDNSGITETNDLCTVETHLKTDLKLDGVYYDEYALKLGNAFPILLEVTNNGGVPIDAVDVIVSGSSIGTYPVDGGLAPGETMEINGILQIPNTMPQNTEFGILVNPIGASDENPLDNSQAITLGKPSVTILLQNIYNDNRTITVSASVSNVGNYDVNAKLVVKDSFGEVVDYSDLGRINAHSAANVDFIYDPEKLVPLSQDYETLTFDVVNGDDVLCSDFAVLYADNGYALDTTGHGIDYSNEELLVYGSVADSLRADFFVNLSQEEIVIPRDFEIVTYSIDGGNKWRKVNQKTFGVNFPNLVRRGAELCISNGSIDKTSKQPQEDSMIVEFAKIEKSRKKPKVSVNYMIASDKTGLTSGDWVLAEKGSDVAYKDYLEIAEANATNKSPGDFGYGRFFTGTTNGIPIKEIVGNQGQTYTYFVRTAPTQNADGTYTAAGKAFKVRVKSEQKAPKYSNNSSANSYKVNYNKELIALKALDMYSTSGRARADLSQTINKADLNISNNINNGTRITIRKGATAKKPASHPLVIEPAIRLPIESIQLQCNKGKITSSLREYEVYADRKWRSLPKISSYGVHTFDIRLKSTIKVSAKGVTGGASSDIAKLIVEYGEYTNSNGKISNGIISAQIVTG